MPKPTLSWKPPAWITLPLLFLLVVAALAAGIHRVSGQNLLGTDYYIYYLGMRSMLVDHTNPYSDEVSLQAQMAVLKRPALPGEDQLGFAYPPYAMLPALPTLALPFDWATALWLAFGLAALTTAVLLAFRRPPGLLPVTLLFLYPASFTLLLGNLDTLLTAVLILAYGLLFLHPQLPRAGQITLGVLLAWATSKPQFTWLFILLFLAAGLRQRRWALLISFSAALAAMLALSFLVLPGWVPLWLEQVGKYQVYNETWVGITLFLRDLLPARAATLLTYPILAGLLGAVGWVGWRWWRGKTSPLWMAAWCGLVVFLAHPHGMIYEQLTFFIPLILWLGERDEGLHGAGVFWWSGSIALSWVFFVLSRLPGVPPSLPEWPFFFYIAWMIWLATRARQPQKPPVKLSVS